MARNEALSKGIWPEGAQCGPGLGKPKPTQFCRAQERRAFFGACYRTLAQKRKDGSGVFVIVRIELALQLGMAVWEAFHDPKDGKVKLDGEIVTAFPKLPEFQQVTLKALRWEERDKRVIVKKAEIVS